MPSGPMLTFVTPNLMLLTGVSDSEGIVKPNLEKSHTSPSIGLAAGRQRFQTLDG
jgi:hypothetical protein